MKEEKPNQWVDEKIQGTENRIIKTGGNMGNVIIAKRRNTYYKYRSYYDKGKRKQEYLGRANWLELLFHRIKKIFK